MGIFLFAPGTAITYIKTEDPIVNNEVKKDEVVIIKTVYAEEKAPEPAPIKDALGEWLDRLAEYECKGCGERFRILDVNNRYSYGCLQFQEATYIAMATRYGFYDEADPDAIYNCEHQKEIARALWLDDSFTTYEKARHWYTSVYVKGLGVPEGY